ncbi:MAG TPA: hemerythrin domain-containing protein [Mycobacteriales bacterium]|nr:hemerythrin domain-containing protein [Mycobacteriales bacterium]
MASDAITLVTKDHRAVENLFATLKEKTGDRAQLLEQLRAELIAHAKAEEAVLYPFIKKALPDERAQVDEGSKEHHEVESMVEKLSAFSADDKAVDALLDELAAAVGHHVEDEENEVLPGLEQAVDEDALRALGESFQQRKAEELSRLVGGGSARESKASKDELAEALKTSRS